ncbi:hypothetical protein [Intestinimonas butyriciproducens]|uniref:hypothetical protein n=1 Tax=Intestinimonas butyriciproducens TaxID=1297617 RepID=UPI0012E0AC0C|nr:hypothetical protein [Intestinimonas butyriciproducens]
MKEQSGHSNYSELERIMKIMEPYIQSCPLYDIVRSDKFGYLLISMPAGDQIDDAELIPLDCAETLLRELYTNLAYDFAAGGALHRLHKSNRFGTSGNEGVDEALYRSAPGISVYP